MKKVVVVIPVYKTDLNDNELLSFKRSIQVLARHPFAIVCPDNLDLGPLKPVLEPVNHEIKRFDEAYFKGLDGYNQLMLSEVFYKEFEEYEYILICQMDVFVFADKLEHWCGKGHDYIGAPWIASRQTLLARLLLSIRNFTAQEKKSTEHHFKVGNGGFSLRRTSTMLRAVLCRNENTEREAIDSGRLHHRDFEIEDLYFSIAAPTLVDIKIPHYTEAVDFCIDRKPRLALKLNRGKLPFACHRFYDRKAKKFWGAIISEHMKGGF